MKKALLIYNPKSGLRQIPGKLDYIIMRFMENDVLIQPYRIGGSGERLKEVAAEGGYDFAVISGGDGTISSVVNTFLNNGINLPLGLIPSGTCNDLARSLMLPSDIEGCIDIILSGRTAQTDAGLINGGRYFLNTCAGGVFVDVTFNTRSELKRNLGPLAYYMKALGEVTNIKPFPLKITTDIETIENNFFLFLIINGRDAGGFSNIIEEADLADGLMDILLIKECQHLELAALLFKVFNGEYLYDRNVMWLRTRECRIEGGSGVALTIDGEKGDSLPIAVRFINRALKFFVR